jgi:hypothetical protein
MNQGAVARFGVSRTAKTATNSSQSFVERTPVYALRDHQRTERKESSNEKKKKANHIVKIQGPPLSRSHYLRSTFLRFLENFLSHFPSPT